MDVLLAGRSSLRLTRIARADKFLRLTPCVTPPDVAGLHASDLEAIGSALPAAFGPFGPKSKIELGFFSREARPRLDSVNARTILSELPSGAFYEVLPSRGGVHLFVEGPAIDGAGPGPLSEKRRFDPSGGARSRGGAWQRALRHLFARSR